MKHCHTAQQDAETVAKVESITIRKQSRDKRACDNCAKRKLRCGGQGPCDKCLSRRLVCTRTRAGYKDPFEDFRVSAGASSSSEPTNLIDSRHPDQVMGQMIPNWTDPSYTSIFPLPLEMQATTTSCCQMPTGVFAESLLGGTELQSLSPSGSTISYPSHKNVPNTSMLLLSQESASIFAPFGYCFPPGYDGITAFSPSTMEPTLSVDHLHDTSQSPWPWRL